MNVNIELSSELETLLREVAAEHQLEMRDFAPRAVQELLAHAVNWWPENQPNINALLNEIALQFPAQELRGAQNENNPKVDVS